MATKDITDKQVCEAYAEIKKQTDDLMSRRALLIEKHDWPYDLLMKMTGQPEKVCYRAMERAEERGLIEYGVSLRSGWLTEKGKELLREEK